VSTSGDNIVVEIKSTFDPSGAKAAERSQHDLTNATKPVVEAFKNTEKEVHASRQALAGLNSVAAAGQGSWMGLTRALEAFGGGLAEIAAKASMVIGALSAGYALGSAIDKWFGISKAISGAIVPAEKFVSIQDKIKAQIGDLNATTLAAVTKQFDTLTASLKATLSEMDRINSIKNELAGKETAAQLAETEANMPPGFARDKAILAKTQERDLASVADRRKQALAKLAAAEEAKKAGEAAVLATESAEGDARKASIIANQNPATSLEDRSAARQRLQIAQGASRSARARQEQLDEAYGNTMAETSNTNRGLALEERTIRARGTIGSKEITTREAEAKRREEQERIEREDRREQINARNREEGEGIARRVTRENWQSQRDQLSAENKRLEKDWLPTARVQDLRDQAAPSPQPPIPASTARVQDLRAQAAANTKQTDSAVATVLQLLQSNSAKLQMLEEKIKNLPR
jgi:hypothetical protein